MMGFMIYFIINMCFFKMFKVFLKSGPSFLKSGPRWEKSLKIGKNACPNPRNSLLLPGIELTTTIPTQF